jgi:hypothetical protein
MTVPGSWGEVFVSLEQLQGLSLQLLQWDLRVQRLGRVGLMGVGGPRA